MAGLDRDRWQVVSPYLDRALEMTAEDRVVWLGTLHAQDPTLAADIETLLEEREAVSREGFLESGVTAMPAPASLAGQTIGAYTLVRQIGQGGMGGVWLARRSDGRFEGQAAVKLLNASLVGQVGEQRFRREGSFLARLTHPHIAHLIDAGVAPTGQPYLVIEHVDGDRIDTYCDTQRLGIEARLRLLLDVLAAVAHAHANLIVHRDLKPSNVLVGNDGKVKLLDFGIAKLLESESPSGEATVLTREGGAVLTPEYAAPEQMTGGHVTTATDVYSLGVLLYVLLAGRHPAGHGTRSAAELLRAIVDTEPERPSDVVATTRPQDLETLTETAARRNSSPDKLRRLLQGDLDTIVAKALKKNPPERYPSVTALADDLRRYLDHQPIGARPDTLAYRTAKFVRRHRLPVTFGGLVLLALLAGLGTTIWQARETARQRDLALAQLVRAESINEFSGFLLGEAVPGGEAVTMRDLIQRAERMVHKRFANDEALTVELLVSIADVYGSLEETTNEARCMKLAFETSLRLEDPVVRANASCGWARVLAHSGNYAEARRLFDSALALLSEDARFDNIAASCLFERGYSASLEGNADMTLRDAQMALDRLREVPNAFTWTRAKALILLALAYEMRGEIWMANAAYEEAMRQLEQIGRDESSTAAVLLNNWARTRGAIDTVGALVLQERAIALEAAGSVAMVPPAALANYGRLLNRLARHAEAKAVCERASAVARQHGNARVMGLSGLALARACRSLGDLECAAKALHAAEIALRSALPAGHFLLADLSREQGLLAATRGDSVAARRLLGEALLLHERASEKHVSHIETLLELTKLDLHTNHFGEADKHARAALELGRGYQAGETHSSWVGLSQLALGTIREARGDPEAARTLYREALSHMVPTLGEAHPAVQDARTRLVAGRCS